MQSFSWCREGTCWGCFEQVPLSVAGWRVRPGSSTCVCMLRVSLPTPYLCIRVCVHGVPLCVPVCLCVCVSLCLKQGWLA